jgi:hypothetical protein
MDPRVVAATVEDIRQSSSHATAGTAACSRQRTNKIDSESIAQFN